MPDTYIIECFRLRFSSVMGSYLLHTLKEAGVHSLYTLVHEANVSQGGYQMDFHNFELNQITYGSSYKTLNL